MFGTQVSRMHRKSRVSRYFELHWRLFFLDTSDQVLCESCRDMIVKKVENCWRCGTQNKGIYIDGLFMCKMPLLLEGPAVRKLKEHYVVNANGNGWCPSNPLYIVGKGRL